MPIADVRYALKSPWLCDEFELGPSSRRRCLKSFFCDAVLGIGALGNLLNDVISLNRRRWL